MTRLWIVRAGKHGEREVEAISQGRLLLGFQEAGDLRKYKDRDAIAEHLTSTMPDANENRIRNFAAQLNQFAHTIKIGDIVVLPRKVTDGVAIGEVTGDYVYDPDGPYKHSRKVKWLKEAVPRSTFKQDLRHSFGAFMTICEVKRNDALKRVLAVVQQNQDPGALVGKEGTVALKHTEAAEDALDAELDIEDIANQQIISLVKSEFSGHGLADLVAEILRAEGYSAKVSPPGADGGVDILAAGGAFGLGSDRICVQVKSGDGAANHDVVLRLIGSVSNSQAQNGLLVSIGGVNKFAQSELDKNYFKLRLWQMDDLLNALYRNYDKLPAETRKRLPLKRIWAPIASDED